MIKYDVKQVFFLKSSPSALKIVNKNYGFAPHSTTELLRKFF